MFWLHNEEVWRENSFLFHGKLAWIDSLHPHRGIRADGEAISILSSKDGHLQGAHTSTTTRESFRDRKIGTLSPAALLHYLRNPEVECWQNNRLPSCPWMVKWICILLCFLIKKRLDSSFPVNLISWINAINNPKRGKENIFWYKTGRIWRICLLKWIYGRSKSYFYATVAVQKDARNRKFSVE